MKYKVNLTDAAYNDLRKIKYHFNYVLKVPETGKKLLQKLKEAMKSLANMPLRHSCSDMELASMGIRVLPIDSYLVFYVVSENTVTVIRIMHGSRDWIRLIQK